MTLPVALALLSCVPIVEAQMNQYEARYGRPVDVSVDDLLQMPEAYVGKAVRTAGRLEMSGAIEGVRYALQGTFGGRLFVRAMTDAMYDWDANAGRWVGQEVEVTGTIAIGADSSTGGRAVFIGIWAFLGPPEKPPADREEVVPETTLERLVTRPAGLEGKRVRVRGQFRGNNLFGDLPSASRRKSSDWVIKDELFAVWVSGKKPRGSGWRLDPGLKRDSGKWLEVTGRVTTRNGVVTIRADEVTLSSPPSPTAQALPPPPPPPRPRKPPVVVFSLPLDGERDVAPDTVFRVQFSSDMDESSFHDRVLLRYAGRVRPGDRPLGAVAIDYDGGQRALEIDPGDLLRPDRVVEIVLLSGIVDIDGRPLQTRTGVNPGAAVDVLRFRTAAMGPSGLLR